MMIITIIIRITERETQSINIRSACLMSPDWLQDGEREDGDTAGGADHVKYAEQADQMEK